MGSLDDFRVLTAGKKGRYVRFNRRDLLDIYESIQQDPYLCGRMVEFRLVFEYYIEPMQKNYPQVRQSFPTPPYLGEFAQYIPSSFKKSGSLYFSEAATDLLLGTDILDVAGFDNVPEEEYLIERREAEDRASRFC